MENNSIEQSEFILNCLCKVINNYLEKTLYDPIIPLGIRDKNSLYLKHKIDPLNLKDIITKEKKNWKKTKKLKIKENNKPKVLKIVNYKSPQEFHNEYLYFVYIVTELGLDYYKYKSSCFWEGPAIILDLDNYSKSKIAKIKSKILIDINCDTLNFNEIAIYPKKKLPLNTIGYQLNYNYPEEDYVCEVIEWTYDGKLYLLDKKTNLVFDFDTEYELGYRIYDVSSKTWSIC